MVFDNLAKTSEQITITAHANLVKTSEQKMATVQALVFAVPSSLPLQLFCENHCILLPLHILFSPDSAPTPPLSHTFFLPFTRGHVLSRIVSHGVEYREKLGKHSEANVLLELLLSQHVYSRHRRGKWWDRLALNFDFHLKDKSKVVWNNYSSVDGMSLVPRPSSPLSPIIIHLRIRERKAW